MKKRLPWVLGLLCALAAATLLTALLPLRNAAADFQAQSPRDQNLAVFDTASLLLEEHHYRGQLFEDASWAEHRAHWREKAASELPALLYVNVLENFARGFPDSHVSFIAPIPAQESRETPQHAANDRVMRHLEAALSGPGYQQSRLSRGGRVHTIVGDVMRGSPAERAGVTPGWLQMESSWTLDEEGAHFRASFVGLSHDELRTLERIGLPGEFATQQLLDEFIAARRVEVAFDMAKLPLTTDFDTRQLPGGVTYVRFDRYESMDLITKTLDAIDAAGSQGVVLDLRHNVGGRALHMARVIGAFLGNNVSIGTTHRAGKSAPMTSLRLTDHYEGPVVVLIGPNTASAAEITAASLQDHKRARLVGRSTSGAVLMGRKFALPDGGALMIPVEDFWRAGERHIEGVGVEPDVWITPTLEDVRAGRDPVLERALQELDSFARE